MNSQQTHSWEDLIRPYPEAWIPQDGVTKSFGGASKRDRTPRGEAVTGTMSGGGARAALQIVE